MDGIRHRVRRPSIHYIILFVAIQLAVFIGLPTADGFCINRHSGSVSARTNFASNCIDPCVAGSSHYRISVGSRHCASKLSLLQQQRNPDNEVANGVSHKPECTTEEPSWTSDDPPKPWRSVSACLLAAITLNFFNLRASVADVAASASVPSTPLASPSVVLSTVPTSLLRKSDNERNRSRRWSLLQTGIRSFCIARIAQQLFPAIRSSIGKFSTFYMSRLSAYPIVTKAITAAFISVVGDAIAQRIKLRLKMSRKQQNGVSEDDADNGTSPSHQHVNDATTGSQNSHTCATIPKTKSWLGWYDKRRGASIFLDCLVISGPLMHYAYDWLETLIPVHTSNTISPALAALLQVILDDTLVDTAFILVTFITTAIGEGYMKDLPRQLRKDFIPTVKAGWATSFFLLPIEFVCFRFLPVSLRVLGMNLVDVVWETMVSFAMHRNRSQVGSADRGSKEGGGDLKTAAAVSS